MATNAREPFYMEIVSGKKVELNLKKSSYSAGLQTALGLSQTEPTPGELVGKGTETALNNGAVPINLVYKKTSTKTQTAKVLCAPSKADTIFTDAVGTQYNGKEIIQVRFPRRRVYTW